MRQNYCDKLTLSRRLQSLMEKRGINLSELACSVGFPRTTIARIVTGATDNPTAQTLIAIADYFAIPIDYLLGRQTKEIDSSETNHEINACLYKKIPLVPWAYIKQWVYNRQTFLSADEWIITDQCLSQDAFAVKVVSLLYKEYFPKDTVLIIDKKDEYCCGDYVLISINRHKPTIQMIAAENGQLYINSIAINAPSEKIGPIHTIYGKIIESRNSY